MSWPVGEDDTGDNVRRPGARGNKHTCEIPVGRPETLDRRGTLWAWSLAEQTRPESCAVGSQASQSVTSKDLPSLRK